MLVVDPSAITFAVRGDVLKVVKSYLMAGTVSNEPTAAWCRPIGYLYGTEAATLIYATETVFTTCRLFPEQSSCPPRVNTS